MSLSLGVLFLVLAVGFAATVGAAERQAPPPRWVEGDKSLLFWAPLVLLLLLAGCAGVIDFVLEWREASFGVADVALIVASIGGLVGYWRFAGLRARLAQPASAQIIPLQPNPRSPSTPRKAA